MVPKKFYLVGGVIMQNRARRFLRVSSASQDEAMQEPDVDRYIAGNGLDCDKTDKTETYRLRASASKGRHQWLLDKVLADARAGQFDVLVAWLPDRLERRGAFRSIHWLQEVMDAGVRVVFAEPTRGPRYDLDTPRGQEELARAASYAAEETELRTTRTEAGRKLAKSNGGMLTIPPWGYDITGAKHHKQFEATDAGREWIRVVFDRAPHMSLRTLRDSLAGTPLAGRTAAGLALMIRNKTYLGYVMDAAGKEIGRCEPLVSVTAWNKANDALENRPHSGGRPKYPSALLAGVITCPRDGRHMYRTSAARYSYYKCDKRDGGCGALVNLAAADRLMVAAMADLDEEIMVRTLIEPGHDWSEDIAKTELELRQLASRGLDYEAEDMRRAELRAELVRLRDLPATADVWDDKSTGVKYSAQWSGLGESERRQWLLDKGIRVYASKDASAVPALITELTAKLVTGNDFRYAVKTDGRTTIVVYFGSMEALKAA
jgi:DNA invertase Pin-like site-specific DNA recombinase